MYWLQTIRTMRLLFVINVFVLSLHYRLYIIAVLFTRLTRQIFRLDSIPILFCFVFWALSLSRVKTMINVFCLFISKHPDGYCHWKFLFFQNFVNFWMPPMIYKLMATEMPLMAKFINFYLLVNSIRSCIKQINKKKLYFLSCFHTLCTWLEAALIELYVNSKWTYSNIFPK